jgi:osmotically inducible protein OsmC
MMKRKASARWNGGLKNGSGTISTASKALSDLKYSFTTRFEDAPGTNPEELIAAAHAGCFSMALSAQLSGAKLEPESIATEATVTMEKQDAGWTITAVHLDVEARVPGGEEAAFRELADTAKKGCPVSRVLNATITMDARLIK